MDKVARGAQAVGVARETGADIQKISKQYKNCRPECTAGRIAEKIHEGTFNMDAPRKGRRDLRARTTGSNSQPHTRGDVHILKNGNFDDDKTYEIPYSIHDIDCEIDNLNNKIQSLDYNPLPWDRGDYITVFLSGILGDLCDIVLEKPRGYKEIKMKDVILKTKYDTLKTLIILDTSFILASASYNSFLKHKEVFYYQNANIKKLTDERFGQSNSILDKYKDLNSH